MNKVPYKIGDTVKLVSRESYHLINIGDKVIVKDIQHGIFDGDFYVTVESMDGTEKASAHYWRFEKVQENKMGDMADDLYEQALMNEDYNYIDIELAEEDFEKDIWTTKDYRKIPLKSMGTEHIKNSIKFINREGNKSVFGLGGDWLPKLKAELERRNIVEDK